MNQRMVNTTVISGTTKKVKEALYLTGDKDIIAAHVVYANDENALFYDSACTTANAVKAADVFAMFVDGIVAVKGGVYYKPTSCTKAGVIVFPFPEEDGE